ncbi:DUF2723 domain-containing protein [Candidatus Gottesmanbacteria bacterium]|nr:DUF2723 domain-containing protein [Candidatus Gottesmanbacteria bacterium]
MKKTSIGGVILTFLLSLAVYTATLPPSITFGDSGEFVTAAYFLGIPHPPGAPFWVILSHFFTYIPFGSIAWRVNFSSAFFASSTIAILYILMSNVLDRKKKFVLSEIFLIMSTALTYAFTRSFWAQAIIAKYFTLNTFLFGILLFLTYKFTETKKPLFFYLFFLLTGFSIATHYLIFLVIPVLLLWIFLVNRRVIWNKRILFISFISFVAGLSVFLYLPIRANANPPINWGNPNTLSTFLYHVTRQQFQRSFVSEATNLGVSLPIASFAGEKISLRIFTSAHAFGAAVIYEFPFYILIFTIVGGIFLLKNSRTRSWAILLFLLFLASGWGFAFLTNAPIPNPSDKHAEYLYAYLLLTLLTGYGVLFLFEKVRNRFSHIFEYLFLALIATSPFLLLINSFKINNWSNNTVAYDHAINILKTLDQNAILIADKNNWVFPLLYASKVEQIRPDVTIYDRTGNLFERVYNFTSSQVHSFDELETFREKVEKNIQEKYPNRPFYFAADKNFENYPREVLQEGILYKQRTFPPKSIDFPIFYKNILAINTIPYDDFDSTYMSAYYHFRFADQLISENKKEQALEELEKAKKIGNDNTLVLTNVAKYLGELGSKNEAIDIYRNLIDRNSANDVVHFNLAVLLEEKKEYDKASAEYKKSIDINPKNFQAIFRLAQLFELGKKYQEALDQYMSLVNLNYVTNYTIEKIVALATRTGQCDLAEMFYGRLSITSNFKVFANNIGICWAQKGEYNKAKIQWEKALEIDNSYDQPKENLKRLESLPPTLRQN